MTIPLNPPKSWFSPPESGIPTDKRITVEGSGRVYGYISLWNTCHVGHAGCVKPPKGSPSNYDYAHQGETLTEDGDLIKTAVIAGGNGHAPVDMKTANVPAYYENTGTQLMRVRYGEDENGLWFAGALWPGVEDLQIAQIRASSISGDWRFHAAWRKSGGQYDFAGACFVNIPGFPMETDGGINDSHGVPYALAASAYIPLHEGDEYIYMDGENLTAGALPYKATSKADKEMSWDGPAEVKKATTREQLRRMHAWVDPNGDPDSKSSYKLPHHTADGKVVWRGVAAAMAALMGARGGVQIPSSDRQAVYNHLAKHYRQFDEEPPTLRASGVDEMDECDGNCTDCNCKKETTDEDILAAVYQLITDRMEEKEAIRAAAETEDTNVNQSVEELNKTVTSLKEAVDWLIADKLTEEISKEN